jgi:hypothetical protein
MAEAFLFLFLSGEEKTENEKEPGEWGSLPSPRWAGGVVPGGLQG